MQENAVSALETTVLYLILLVLCFFFVAIFAVLLPK